MKYYKLLKNSNEKVKEISKEDIKLNNSFQDIKPAKIYENSLAYYGVGEASRKFLSIIEKAQRNKMNKEMEKYWDDVANRWVEKLESEEKDLNNKVVKK